MTFSGTVSSDFLKLIDINSTKKSNLIDFAGTDFDTLRANLVNYIKAVYPLDYNNFVESDLGIMLIDLVAYVGATTSMKADFLANESFLRTAKIRNNVKKLLELVGVRLKGPISAAANARLSFSVSPYTSEQQSLEIPFTQRTITINSPEDSRPLTYTLYKVTNGLVDLPNKDASILLQEVEATDASDEGAKGVAKIHDNLVLLEGSFVRKTGTFGGGPGIKTIDLDVGPVVEGSIQVFVSGQTATSGVYRQVDNIYFASGPTDKTFQLISDDDFRGVLVFGDNRVGISPNATDGYVVTYRVGGGTRGNIAPEVINAPLSVQVGLTTANGILENTSLGTGGADVETVENAKKYAGLTFRRQDRLVTLQDYASFTNSFISNYGSVGKATASVRRAFSSANIIDIYVLERANNTQLRKATPTFKKQLIEAIDPKKMLTDEVIVVDGLIRTLDLVITARIDREIREQEEIIKTQIRDIILNYMNIGNREFGQEFNPQDLARAIFQNDYVIFATVDNYPEVVKVDFNEIIQLNNLTINITRV